MNRRDRRMRAAVLAALAIGVVLAIGMGVSVTGAGSTTAPTGTATAEVSVADYPDGDATSPVQHSLPDGTTNAGVQLGEHDSQTDAGDGPDSEFLLVYIESGDPPRPGVTVETLKDRANRTQAPLERYADRTPGVTVENSFWLGNIVVVRVDRDRVDVADLATVENVARVRPNFEVPATNSAGTGTAIDPTRATVELAPTQASSDLTWGLDEINASAVWTEYGTKGEGVTVAVLDTGIDPDHPDIALNRWGEWDKSGNPVGTSPQDYDRERTPGGHGTHVSGTVSGGDAGGIHIGVAPNVTLDHGAVLTDCDAYNCRGTLAQIIAGMQWAVDNDVDVLSMSLGATGYYEEFISPIRDARSAGTIVVASSGNGGDGTTSSPGNVYDTFSVGSSDWNADIASTSSGEVIDTADDWGSDAPDDWPAEYVVPTLSAPGVLVNSSLPGGDYGHKNGTSMAAPHVSGAIALLQSATGVDLDVDDLETVLVETAWKPPGEPDNPDTRYGNGIIDVKAAVDLVKQGSEFNATVNATNSPVAEGDLLEVTVDVENIGNWTATQQLTLSVSDSQQDAATDSILATEEVTLDDGANTTVTFTVDTWNESMGVGDYDVEVATDNSTATTTVTVEHGVGTYANEDGIVRTSGVFAALNDWRDDTVDSDLVLDVVGAWRSENSVA